MMNQSTIPIILGLWPLAGITSGKVSQADGLATIQAAIDAGITCFDTAYSYGFAGESDRMLGEVLRRKENTQHKIKVIGKVGQRWNSAQQRVIDATPATLTADAEASLARIGIEKFDLLMLHAVDINVDIKRSAAAIEALHQRGLADSVGVCNVNVEELKRFADVCPCSAIQCPLNVLQQESLDPLIRVARDLSAEAHVYWTLMKGLLAGKITRDQVFGEGDSRPKYEVFQGTARARAHDFVDRLTAIATREQTTVACLAIGWALSQKGVTSALVGAKKPPQIQETVHARPLAPKLVTEIEQALVF
jgi:aryl-alcohol dehydrogenase-like predicted oxidoreductase